MKSIYASPMRVYLVLGIFALVGVYCGLNLPISLFPNSSRPQIVVGIPYGNLTADEFEYTYGRELESKIAGIDTETVTVENLEAEYRPSNVRYRVEFEWGTPPRAAVTELNNTVTSYSARLPRESREGMWTWLDMENAGFFAVSFFSAERDLDSLYDIIEPAFSAKIAKVPDAEEAVIYNPSRKEIRIELSPVAMAALQLFPRDVESALDAVLGSNQGGSVTVGTAQIQIRMPRTVNTIEDLERVPIATPSGQTIHLSDISRIDFAPSSTWTRSFKTNGASSLILFATPVAGGNIKRMSEDLLAIVAEVTPTLPPDVQHRTLVDPSEFIRNSVNNVVHEVFLAALIATAILFFFIGNARNVLTAAIEIPLSMVLAFILMRMFDMNLNLISLGGLALSAGMNVDASVVVMENIFRHFKMSPGPHTYAARLNLITEAVKEVRMPVIAATIASLVVFLPLAFTSELTYAILGDLAKAVVFSHGFSAMVALVLVPTIRLQLMTDEGEKKPESGIQSWIKALENAYGSALGKFLARGGLRLATYGGLVIGLVALLVFVLPRLPREIVGKPDTDWMVLGIRTDGNTLNSQMESQALEVERKLLDRFGSRILYTFNQVQGPNRAALMARLKDKSDMNAIWKEMEQVFTNTPTTRFGVEPWNPSELQIPDPPHLQIAIRGNKYEDQVAVARDLHYLISEEKIFDRVFTDPNVGRDKAITLRPRLEQWGILGREGVRATPSDVSDLLRVATTGRTAGYLPVKEERMPILLRYPLDTVSTPEQVASLPVGVGEKLVPVKALADVSLEPAAPDVYRKNEQDVVYLYARTDKGEEHRKEVSAAKAREIVSAWKTKHGAEYPTTTVTFEDPEIELTNALRQLAVAVSLSVALIFLTLLIQFGDAVAVLLILISVPLGFIGVLGALFVFGSTLSLNSVLGVILLNGIAVANSILLVDFIRRLAAEGMSPRAAAVEAGRKRIRPILITSLTTILGMLPIALGAGDGGRILQPLGITVSAGLWVSTALTLFIVPALQVAYLEWRPAESFRSLRHRFFARFPRLSRGSASGLLLCFLAGTAGAAEPQAPVTFDQAVAAIVERSTGVAGAKATRDAVDASNVPNDLIYLPTISVTGEYETGKRFLGTGDSSSRSVSASARLNLFKFGADRAAQNLARAERSRHDLLIADSVLRSELDAVNALTDLVQTTQIQRVRGRAVEIRESALGIAKQRYAKGLLAKEEVDKVRIEMANAVALLRDAETDTVAARARVVQLLGHAEIVIDWPWKEQLGKTTIATTEADALRERPDWRAAERQVDASHHEARRSFGNIFPSLDAVGTYGYLDDITNKQEGFLWSAGVTLTIPLFDRLENVSEYRADVYRKAAAEASLEQTRRSARQDWLASKNAFTISLETARVREQTAQLSRDLYEANLQRFQRGLVNVNDLLIDEDRLINSEILSVRGWSTAHRTFGELCRALGKRLAACLNG